MNIKAIIFVIIIFEFMMTIVNANNTVHTTYISYVDDGLGFYKIRNLDVPPREFIYDNRILNINQGDVIIWQNDAEKTTFTIMSNQNLWDSNVGYLRVGSKINYKFDKPGKYTFYIKEYSSMQQTIIVNAIDGASTDTPATIHTAIPTAIPTVVSTAIPGEYRGNSTVEITPFKPVTINTPDIKSPNIHNTDTLNIDVPIKLSPTSIVSIMVVILSVFITYRAGKNKKR